MLRQGGVSSPLDSNLVSFGLRPTTRQTRERSQVPLHAVRRRSSTISTNRQGFPEAIAEPVANGKMDAAELGPALISAVEKTGFKVSERKSRVQSRHSRTPAVTGLTVIEFARTCPRSMFARFVQCFARGATTGMRQRATEHYEKYRVWKGPAEFAERHPRGKMEWLADGSRIRATDCGPSSIANEASGSSMQISSQYSPVTGSVQCLINSMKQKTGSGAVRHCVRS